MLSRQSSSGQPFRGGPSSRPFSSRPVTNQSRPDTSRPTTGQTRPWTAQTRPGTARPTTGASVRHEGSYFIALLEGRGVGREVGIAALDKETGRVMLVQVRLDISPIAFLGKRLRTARRLPNVRQDPPSDAPPPSHTGPRPRHFYFVFGVAINVGRIHIRRVPWSACRAHWPEVLERNRRYVDLSLHFTHLKK
jgi:hypothetical protein